MYSIIHDIPTRVPIKANTHTPVMNPKIPASTMLSIPPMNSMAVVMIAVTTKIPTSGVLIFVVFIIFIFLCEYSEFFLQA